MRRSFILMIFVAVCLISGCAPAAAPATSTPLPATSTPTPTEVTQTCPEIVNTALENLDRMCEQTGRNQVCYGNRRIELESRADATAASFSAPGDTVNLADIARISLSPMDVDAGEWGFALMRAQANLEDTLPGQNVTFLLFGGTSLVPEQAQNGLQAFRLQSGIGAGAECEQAPASGVLIQTPLEAMTVQFVLNGVEIELGSTLYAQADAGDAIWLGVVEGLARVTSAGVTELVQAGTRTTVALDDAGNAAGAPSAAEPYSETEVRSLPVLPLERTIQVAPPRVAVGRSDLIEIGFLIDDAIAESGEVDTYTFEAPQGQTIFLDGQLSSTSGYIVMDLVAPDNTIVFNNLYAGGDSGAIDLLQSGSYTLTVRSTSDSETGEYVIQVWDVPPPDQAETSVGQIVAGSIETPGVSDRYTFTGKQGQTIFLDGQLSSASGNIVMNLVTPDDAALVGTLYVGSDSGTLTLPQDGAYTLVINGNNTSTVGEYAIQIWDVPAPDSAETRIGQVLTGSIEQPGASDRYTFSAAAGQTIFFDGQRSDVSGSITLVVTAPDGSETLSRQWVGSDSGDLLLEQDGTYTVTIDGTGTDGTGDYAVQIWDVSGPQIIETRIGEVLTGNIEQVGETDLYTFEATEGQTIFVDGQLETPSGSITMTLMAPDGTAIVPPVWVGSDYGSLYLTQSGTYTLSISGGDTSETGEYVVQVWDVPPVEYVTLQPAAGQDGANVLTALAAGEIVIPGEMDGFTFEARAGQRLTLTGQDQSASGSIIYLLRAPDGSELLSGRWIGGSEEPLALRQTGTYELLVDGNHTSSTGTYALEIRLEISGR